MEDKNEYTFPFSTCEKPKKNGIAQPYSSLINFVNCVIILYYLLKTKQDYTFILLSSILAFESFHLFSHIVHIPGSIQLNITHSLVYLMNLAFFYAFYCYTNKIPSYEFVLFLAILVWFDIYSLFNLTIIYYI